MADDANPLVLIRGNDTTLTFWVTDPGNNNAPFSLTGCTLTFVRKKNRWDPDTDPSAIIYSVTPDSDQATNTGKATTSIPASDNSASGSGWARLDVVKAGKLRTAETWQLDVRAV